MKKTGFIVAGVLALLLFIGLSLFGAYIKTYNQLQLLDEGISANWAQVENQLKRRNDLIPNFVETVKGYATHEKEIFTSIAESRAKLSGAMKSNDVKAVSESSAQLNSALSRLLVVVERYPDLKANQSFIALQDELAGTENRIAVARKDYNESVRILNALRRTFPTSLVAKIGGVKAREYFEVDESEKAAPQVKF